MCIPEQLGDETLRYFKIIQLFSQSCISVESDLPFETAESRHSSEIQSKMQDLPTFSISIPHFLESVPTIFPQSHHPPPSPTIPHHPPSPHLAQAPRGAHGDAHGHGDEVTVAAQQLAGVFQGHGAVAHRRKHHVTCPGPWGYGGSMPWQYDGGIMG